MPSLHPPSTPSLPLLLRSSSPHSPRLPQQLSLLSHHRPHQIRNATLLPRPKRPYTFTQLLTLSDGSTYTHRTSSPIPVYKSTKDIRNVPLWNPSSQKLMNIEADEAGRLRAFRRRFGRGWDARRANTKDGGLEGIEEESVGKIVGGDLEGVQEEGVQVVQPEGEEYVDQAGGRVVRRVEKVRSEGGKGGLYEGEKEERDNLLDLISGFERTGEGGSEVLAKGLSGEVARTAGKAAKGKKGKK